MDGPILGLDDIAQFIRTVNLENDPYDKTRTTIAEQFANAILPSPGFYRFDRARFIASCLHGHEDHIKAGKPLKTNYGGAGYPGDVT